MTQPQRVIYLPPGVVPTQPVGAPAQPLPSGIPFDRKFFEETLPAAIKSFCNQVECPVPLVELLTVDGATHYVNGISGVSDLWVALHTASVNHEHPTQIFVPYGTIFRIEIHPEHDEGKARLGFLTAPDADQRITSFEPPKVVSPEEQPAKRAKSRKQN